MNFTQTPIEGVHLIEERPHKDERGFFSRKYCHNELPVPIAQINHSQSRLRGTLRGLHYQEEPHQEIKIVSCIKGKIWDIGNSSVVTVPAQYIKDGILWQGDEFKITVDTGDK